MFAVVLEGRGGGRGRLEALSRAAHAAIGRGYAPTYQPHVTLGVVSSENFDKACELGSELSREVAPLRLTISALSLFPNPPGVLFAGPVPCDALVDSHRQFTAIYDPFREHLMPYWNREEWVPHVTLLSPVPSGDQARAVAAIATGWEPFVFDISALSVVRLPDVAVLATFELGTLRKIPVADWRGGKPRPFDPEDVKRRARARLAAKSK